MTAVNTLVTNTYVCTESWGRLLNISGISNLQHPVSSLPSVHSRVPSQRLADRMHWRLLHWNAPDLQETVWTEFSVSNQDNRNGEFNYHLHWWVSDFRLVQLTAVHLITAITTGPEPITLWRRGDTETTGSTLKLARSATWVKEQVNGIHYKSRLAVLTT